VLEYVFEYAFLVSHVLLQGLIHFDEILMEADGVIIARGNLGLDLPPEKVVLKPEHRINIMLLVKWSLDQMASYPPLKNGWKVRLWV
jgi:hypothetical protein